MYYSQPLRPPCCNTPAEGKTAVQSNTATSAAPKQKLPKGRPSIIKEKDNSTKKTVTYRSGALDTYDFGSWTRDAYEQKEETVPGKIYSGVIIDRKGNRYTIKGDMEATGNGSRLGGFNYYYQIEIVSTDIVVFSHSSDIIHDLEQGYYLEDYLVKNREYIRFVDDTNVRGKAILASLDSIDASDIKSYEQKLSEQREKAVADKRNNALSKLNAIFRLSDNKRYWVEQTTGFELLFKNCKEKLSVIDGFISGSNIPDKHYLVRSMFGQPVTNFPARATYSCNDFFTGSKELCEAYGYAEYYFIIGFSVGTEDISSDVGLPGPIYAVNVYLVNNTSHSHNNPNVVKHGSTSCVPVIEQQVIDKYLCVKEIEHNMLAGVDTRCILNHPDFDRVHACTRDNYYIFRGEVWAVDDLLIDRIRTAIYKGVEDTDGWRWYASKPLLTSPMVKDTLGSMWGQRHELQYNLKSDVFYFVMDLYMYSLNLNHDETSTAELSALCSVINTKVRGIDRALARISCKAYKTHVNNVKVKYNSQ